MAQGVVGVARLGQVFEAGCHRWRRLPARPSLAGELCREAERLVSQAGETKSDAD